MLGSRPRLNALAIVVVLVSVGAEGLGRAAGVDGCTAGSFLDRTGAPEGREFDWDFPFATSDDRCIRIYAGQSVHWVGNFVAHPLQADMGDTPNPIDGVGASGVVTFPSPG